VITASSIATDAVTEIQSGLATALQVEQFVAASELNLESLLVDIPTVAEFNARSLPSADYFVVSDYTEPDNAGIAANGVAISNVPTLAEIEASTVLAKEATVAAKASQSSVDTKPTLSQIEASTILAKEATVESKASQTSVDGKPSLAQIEASTVLAKEATVLTVASYLDTEMAAVKAVTDKLNTTVELDGLVYRFTINALEQAPSGGGGGGGNDTELLNDIYNRVLKLGNTATMNSRPVMSGRLQTLIRGDSYLIANETSLDWNKTPVPGFVLEDTTARFGMKNVSTGETYIYDGQSVTLLEVEGEDDQWLVQIEFTEVDSLSWVTGDYSWALDLVHDGVSITIDRSTNYRGETKVIDKETIE
jgi:hypothetical protein